MGHVGTSVGEGDFLSGDRQHFLQKANMQIHAQQLKGKGLRATTLYLGFEQQIIPGHLSYGIQVRTDVPCISHLHQHSCEEGFLGQERMVPFTTCQICSCACKKIPGHVLHIRIPYLSLRFRD